MPSTAEEFRKRARTIVRLPSGMEVEIRKLHLWDFFGLNENPLPSAHTEGANGEDESTPSISQEQMEEVREYSIQAIIRASIHPKFTAKEDPDPNIICVEDLNDADFQGLAQGILTWMQSDSLKAESGESNGST